MSRMLQALRQIEAKTERWPQPAVSAAAAHAVALQSAPTTNVVEAAQEAFDRVEAALAAENPGPPDSLAALQIEPLPGLDALAAPTSAADPYAASSNVTFPVPADALRSVGISCPLLRSVPWRFALRAGSRQTSCRRTAGSGPQEQGHPAKAPIRA